MLSLLGWGLRDGPEVSVRRAARGAASPLSLGMGSTGAMDLLLVLFERKKENIFF